MKLKVLFFILVILFIGIWGLVICSMLYKIRLIVYLSEALIAISILYLIYFYMKVIKPYKNISLGIELLKEQDFSNKLCKVGQSESDEIVDVFNKLMEQLRNERLQAQEQNYLLDLLIKVSPIAVIIFDFDNHIAQCNKTALNFLECNDESKLTGKELSELNTPLSDALSKLSINEKKIIRIGDNRIFRCSNLFFFDHGFQHPFMLIDSLTSEVTSAEKKAYEKVIRMIVHEVNNTTAGITSTLDSISSAISGIEDMNDLNDVIEICVERCYNMSKFITNFANVVKIPEPNLVLTDLNEEIKSCKIFMENLCKDKHITLHINLTECALNVPIDVTLFEQVITNIIKNAVESIGDKGNIYIRTNKSPVELEIIDDGEGIDKENEEKLFTPFFSTKPQGQGIGLMFISEVLLQHNCTFSLRTYNDNLTHFCIKFQSKY